MVLNTIDMLQWTDKKLTTCLVLLLLELFLDGKLLTVFGVSADQYDAILINTRRTLLVDKQVRKVHRQRQKLTDT